MAASRKGASASSARVRYGVHPSVAYQQAILSNLQANTGKSLEQWVRLAKRSGSEGERERRDWLKAEFGLGGTTAWMIAERSCGKAEGSDGKSYLKVAPGYVEAMYSGAKAGLRPIHDRLIRLGLTLGKDVKVCPCKTIVPLYRKHVFAEIKPSTRTRLDFGLALGSARRRIPARLIDTGGSAKGDRITHRFALTKMEEIDEVVERWMGIAYELDG